MHLCISCKQTRTFRPQPKERNLKVIIIILPIVTAFNIIGFQVGNVKKNIQGHYSMLVFEAHKTIDNHKVT